MKELKRYIKDFLTALLLAIFITVITSIGIYPLVAAILNMDDFDGYWLIIIMQTIQLTATIFIGFYIIRLKNK